MEATRATTKNTSTTASLVRFHGYILGSSWLAQSGCGGKAAVVYAVAELYAGRHPSCMDCCQGAYQRFCQVFSATFLVDCFVIGWRFLFSLVLRAARWALSGGGNDLMVLSVYLVIMCAWIGGSIFIKISLWALLTPIIMVEGQGPLHAIKRNMELSEDNLVSIFGIVYCWVMVYVAAKLLLASVLVLLGGIDFLFSTLGGILIHLPYCLYFSFVVIAEMVTYLNIRVEHEGLNKDVLERELYGDISITKSKYTRVDCGVVEPETA